jgi:hypothetical protein
MIKKTVPLFLATILYMHTIYALLPSPKDGTFTCDAVPLQVGNEKFNIYGNTIMPVNDKKPHTIRFDPSSGQWKYVDQQPVLFINDSSIAGAAMAGTVVNSIALGYATGSANTYGMLLSGLGIIVSSGAAVGSSKETDTMTRLVTGGGITVISLILAICATALGQKRSK